jgi:hypothetical protein
MMYDIMYDSATFKFQMVAQWPVQVKFTFLTWRSGYTCPRPGRRHWHPRIRVITGITQGLDVGLGVAGYHDPGDQLEEQPPRLSRRRVSASGCQWHWQSVTARSGESAAQPEAGPVTVHRRLRVSHGGSDHQSPSLPQSASHGGSEPEPGPRSGGPPPGLRLTRPAEPLRPRPPAPAAAGPGGRRRPGGRAYRPGSGRPDSRGAYAIESN